MARQRCLQRTTVILFAAVAAACGGRASPGAPTPVATPSPTPRPPVAFTLTAPSDHFRFSARLRQVVAGESFDVAFTPRSINEVEGETFGHSVEFWLLEATTADAADFTNAFALALVWARGEWEVASTTPGVPYRFSGLRVAMPLGEQRVVRIVRSSSDAAEFLLDGRSVLTLRGVPPTTNVFARVVATEATFVHASD